MLSPFVPPKGTAVYVPVLLLALAVAYGFWGFSYDDNFITYRYAQNVLEGEGLVFNPGERVLGTSAPGYALLLAGLAFLTRPLGVDVPPWGTLVALASIVVVTGVLAAAAKRDRAWTLPVAFAALALTSHLNLHLLGSEAFAVLALVVLAAHLLLVAERDAAAGLLVGAAMCLRLDAGLAALVLGLVTWGRRRRFPFPFAAAGLGVLAAWLVFLSVYFGRVIPNTFGGKTALYEVPYTLRQWQTLTATLPTASSVVLLAGAVLGLVVVWREGLWRHPVLLGLGLWILGHEVVYRAIGVWFAPWYHVYLWHALLALYALAAFEAASWTAERLRLGGKAVFAVVLGVLLAVVLVPSARFVAGSWREPPDPRYRLYEEAGAYVREHVDPTSEVLAMEIGVFGYFGERRILDLGALVSPRFTEAKFSDSRPQLVAQLQPAYILAGRRDPLMRQVLEHEGVRGRYEEVARFTDAGAVVRLLRRRDEDR